MRLGHGTLFILSIGLVSLAPSNPANLLLNEVRDFGEHKALSKTKHTSDDYTDFEENSLLNSGANHNLKVVPLEPAIEEEHLTFRSQIEEEFKPLSNTQNKLRGRPKPRIQHRGQVKLPVPRKYLSRVGYYFQHYPYDKLDRFYQLNPHLYYNYPRGYEHVQWAYPVQGTEYFRARQFYHLPSLGPYG